METIEFNNKDFFVKELVSLFTNPDIAATAAGGIFVFKYGKYVVDKYTPTELMAAAHNADSRVKERYAAELNAAFLIYRYFQKNPSEFEFTKSNVGIQKASDVSDFSSSTNTFLAALRTKPFMLLAGISGTGKSRIVRKLAQAS